MPILEPKYECMDRSDLRQLQLERLQAVLNRVVRNVAYYQETFKRSESLPSDFRSFDDLSLLPLIDRRTLADNHPYGMFAVPLREVVRLHPSHSARWGEPIVIGHTKNDILAWTHVKARGFAAANITQSDMVQVYLDYTLFPGAVVAHYGAEQLGACVTPLYNMPIADQIPIMRNYRATVLICTPTRAVHIVRYLREHQIDPKSLFLRAIVFVGESWSNRTRRQVEESLFVDVFGNYGVSEICMPGIAFECEAKNGLHINEDHFLAEIIDPETGRVLPPGRRGELVLTTLTREAFPLIRFRTGVSSALTSEPCPCGRTLARMENVTHRTDDMLVVEGVEFTPSEIGMVLSQMEHVSSHYRLVIQREETRDRLEVEVEITPDIFIDSLGPLETLRERIEEAIFERIHLKPVIKLVEPKSLEGRDSVLDQRENNQSA
ncbi:MAG TPA: phenylacetate--CoA ligase [bacterium]|nr:phenylacetate--CoA ligase [bacterium]